MLLFTASDFTSITSHIHNWVLFLLWLCLFTLSGVLFPLISSSILGTYQPREFIFQCPIFLPFHSPSLRLPPIAGLPPSVNPASNSASLAHHLTKRSRFVLTLTQSRDSLPTPLGLQPSSWPEKILGWSCTCPYGLWKSLTPALSLSWLV